MPRVNFDQLSPSQYEDMVSVLLSRVRQAHRVDGSGGDGGRDCYFTDSRGTDAYEMKGFTGRMTRGRRQQVKRSLNRAMQKSPRTWTLIVPIDPTPAEQEWFDSLRSSVSADLEWCGKTWLEEQLAGHPDIPRYFGGSADEVMRLLTDIAREEALPSDAVGLAQRFTAAVSRLNEIDPYYSFEYTVMGGASTVTARPRYPDAPHDRPIQVSTKLRFNNSSASREAQAALDEFMVFGTKVNIPAANVHEVIVDAPGGLGGDFSHGELILDGSFQPGPQTASEILLRIPPHPPVRQVLKLHITSRSMGPAGGLRLVAQDSAGLLTLDFRVNRTRRDYQAGLRYRFVPGALPQDAVPVLRLGAALGVGERVAFTDLSGVVFGTGSGAFGSEDFPEDYIRCAEALAEIQQLAGAFFPLPPSFTPEDQYCMEYAGVLLRGEDAHVTWNGAVSQCTADVVRFLLEQSDETGEVFSFFHRAQETLQVAGGQIPLGWVMQIAHSTRITNIKDVRAWYEAGAEGQIEVHLDPANNNDMTVRLAPDEPANPTAQATPSTARHA
jgi:hypothetical protein